MLLACYRGFVAGFGDAAARQGIDDGGFSDVGNAHNHRLDFFDPGIADADHFARQFGNLFDFIRLVAIYAEGFDALVLLEMVLPLRRQFRVGKVTFVENLDAGLVSAQFGNHRVFAGAGQARIQHFDEQVHFR